MTAEILLLLARTNLAAGLAIAVVLALRAPVRRWVGPEDAFALWLAAPAAAGGVLVPLSWASGSGDAIGALNNASARWLAADSHGAWLGAVWLCGFIASAGLAAGRQARFARVERAGLAGPAAVGILRPRIVTPSGFEKSFTPEEQRLIRAHERAHIDRQDGRLAALAEAAAWICWFNPLSHVAVRALRLDQELACDARALQRIPGARRAYADALLRSHAAGPQFGCGWRGSGPLETRLITLAREPRRRWRSELGLAAAGVLSLGLFAAGETLAPRWAPPVEARVVLVELAPADAAVAARAWRWLPGTDSPAAARWPDSYAPGGRLP